MKTILLKEAAALIPDGASMMIGGFMGAGTPERRVDELVRQGTRNLTRASQRSYANARCRSPRRAP